MNVNFREGFLAHFGALFSSTESPRTQDVADAIFGLIRMPVGTRPLRTACGIDFDANRMNQLSAPFKRRCFGRSACPKYSGEAYQEVPVAAADIGSVIYNRSHSDAPILRTSPQVGREKEKD